LQRAPHGKKVGSNMGLHKPSKTKNIKSKSTPSSNAFKNAARTSVRKL
jgi:hypothetical protein